MAEVTRAERAEQMRERIGRYRASGLTRQQFCEREGVSVWTLAKWIGRLGLQVRRSRRREQQEPRAAFVRAQVVSGASPSAVEYAFGDGGVVRFGAQVPLDQAVRAVRGLRGVS
jgi:hypothetical protein